MNAQRSFFEVLKMRFKTYVIFTHLISSFRFSVLLLFILEITSQGKNMLFMHAFFVLSEFFSL